MRTIAITGTLLCCVPLLAAQSAPAGTRASEAAESSIVVLSEFRVDSTTDRGYVATQAAGATRTKTPLIELAHTVNVLNEEFIVDSGAAKLFDALRYVSNVTGGDVRNDGDFGIGALGMRGFPVNRMRNGMIVTGASALVDLAGYERVEVVKGASAVLLGSSNPGGLLNYVPKTPRFSRATTLMLQVDEHGHRSAMADTTGPLYSTGDFRSAYRVVLSGQDSESWMDYHNRDQIFIQASLIGQLGRDTTITARFETQQETTRESIGAPYAYYVNPTITPVPIVLDIPIGFYRGELDDRKKAYTHTIDLNAETRLGSGWILSFKSYGARAFTDRLETFILNPGPTTPTNAWVRQTQRIPRLTRALAAEGNLLGRFDTGAVAHELLIGMTTLGNKSKGTNERWDRGTIDPLQPVYGLVPLGNKTVNLSSETTDTYYGAYAQDRITMMNGRLILNGGARWDVSRNTDFNRITSATTARQEQKWSTSYSMLYRVTNGISLYVSSNENYQPAPPGTDIRGNRFIPLQGIQYEAGAKFEFLEGRLSGNVAAYQITLKNSRTPDPTAPGFSVQGGTTASNGYEADVAWSPTRNLQLIAGVSTNKFRRNAEIEATAPPGYQDPIWQPTASFWGKYDFTEGSVKGLGLGLGMVYEGERHPTFDRRYTVPGYTVFNGLLRYGWSRYKVAVNVENILNDRYVARIEEARQASFGPPRTLKLTFTVSL